MHISPGNASTESLTLVCDSPARSDEPTFRPSGVTRLTDCHARHVV